MPRCISGNHFAAREGEKNCAACVNSSRTHKPVPKKLNPSPILVNTSTMGSAEGGVDWEALGGKLPTSVLGVVEKNVTTRRETFFEGGERSVSDYTFEELDTIWELQKPEQNRRGFFVEKELLADGDGRNPYKTFADILTPKSLNDIYSVVTYFKKREERIRIPEKVIITDADGNEHDLGLSVAQHYGAAVDLDIDGSLTISTIMTNSSEETEQMWMEFFRETVRGHTGDFKKDKPRSVIHKFVRGFVHNTNNLEYLQEILDWDRVTPQYNKGTFQRPTLAEDISNAVTRIRN